MERLPCVVYRGDREADTYLYVEHADDFSRVPEELLSRMGRLEAVLEVELHPERVLARADTIEVMRALREEGFYLQMPPREGLGVPVEFRRRPCSDG